MPSVSSNQFFLWRRKHTCYKQTSRIACSTVGGALRWCWCMSFCKPSSLSDTTLPANHHIPCLSITFACLGILFLTLQVREILHTCYKQTSRITCCTVGGRLRWCWCQPFCKPSRTSDTSYTCNPSSPCLSIPFTCLGILFLTLKVSKRDIHDCLYFLPSGACFCFLYTPLLFPHYSASDLRLPFLHSKHSVIPSSFGIVLT